MFVDEFQLLGYLKRNLVQQPLHVFGYSKRKYLCLLFHNNSPLVPIFNLGSREPIQSKKKLICKTT